jgi:hypothetical protein
MKTLISLLLIGLFIGLVAVTQLHNTSLSASPADIDDSNIPYTAADVGGENINADALAKLNEVRKKLKIRYQVVSGFRSKEENKEIGGAKHSRHMDGLAFDILVPDSDQAKFYEAAKASGFVAFGWAHDALHIDTGSKRWWTYDDASDAMYGSAKCSHLDKAPINFINDPDYGARAWCDRFKRKRKSLPR